MKHTTSCAAFSRGEVWTPTVPVRVTGLMYCTVHKAIAIDEPPMLRAPNWSEKVPRGVCWPCVISGRARAACVGRVFGDYAGARAAQQTPPAVPHVVGFEVRHERGPAFPEDDL